MIHIPVIKSILVLGSESDVLCCFHGRRKTPCEKCRACCVHGPHEKLWSYATYWGQKVLQSPKRYLFVVVINMLMYVKLDSVFLFFHQSSCRFFFFNLWDQTYSWLHWDTGLCILLKRLVYLPHVIVEHWKPKFTSGLPLKLDGMNGLN